MNKNVLNKLSKIESKVELAEVKVDLALVDDVKAAYKDGQASFKNAFDTMMILRKQVDNSLKGVEDSLKRSRDVMVILDKYEAAVKELGMPLPKDFVDQRDYIKGHIQKVFPDMIKMLRTIKF
jgi:hypothetical protein